MRRYYAEVIDTVCLSFLSLIAATATGHPQRQQQKLECNANVSSLTLEVNVTCDIPYSRNVTPVIDCHSTRVFHEQMSVAYQEKSIFSFRKEFKNNDGIPVIKCYLYYATPGQPRSTASPPAMDLPVKVNVIRPAENGSATGAGALVGFAVVVITMALLVTALFIVQQRYNARQKSLNTARTANVAGNNQKAGKQDQQNKPVLQLRP